MSTPGPTSTPSSTPLLPVHYIASSRSSPAAASPCRPREPRSRRRAATVAVLCRCRHPPRQHRYTQRKTSHSCPPPPVVVIPHIRCAPRPRRPRPPLRHCADTVPPYPFLATSFSLKPLQQNPHKNHRNQSPPPFATITPSPPSRAPTRSAEPARAGVASARGQAGRTGATSTTPSHLRLGPHRNRHLHPPPGRRRGVADSDSRRTHRPRLPPPRRLPSTAATAAVFVFLRCAATPRRAPPPRVPLCLVAFPVAASAVVAAPAPVPPRPPSERRLPPQRPAPTPVFALRRSVERSREGNERRDQEEEQERKGDKREEVRHGHAGPMVP